jgi:uncharacterized protein with ACT and thioredoxin-like domain
MREKMKVKIEFRNAKMVKIAECLEKSKLDSGYKLWLYDSNIFAYFKIKDISDLKELIKKLKTMKNVRFIFHNIEEERTWLKKIRFSL